MDALRRIGLSRAINALVLGFLLVACASARPTEVTGTTEGGSDAPAAVPATGLPPGVPHGYLATPVGYMHASCLHHVRSDEMLGADRVIRAADGSTRTAPSCGYPRFDQNG